LSNNQEEIDKQLKERDNLRMENKQLAEQQETINRDAFISLKERDKLAVESARVANVAKNSEKHIAEIEEEFKKQTKLNKIDMGFLFTAIGLQVARQYLLTQSKDFPNRPEHNKKTRLSKNDKINKWLQNLADEGVPYDHVAGTGGWGHNNGKGHRYRTLGHDPILGYIFGTANIFTNSLTTYAVRSYDVGKLRQSAVKAEINTINDVLIPTFIKNLIFGNLEEKGIIGLAVLKQAIHIKTDIFTKKSLSIPFTQLIKTKDGSLLGEKLASYGVDMANVAHIAKSIAKQVAFAQAINMLISMVHSLPYFLNEKDKSEEKRRLYQVRTKKIIAYSNVIASSSNIIASALTNNLKILDIGGFLVTFTNVFKSVNFYNQIQNEYIVNNFNALIQGSDNNNDIILL
jgi:hypothetical protein